ncbi:MAG TPA: TlpA disulfide reductase family protein [Candidatus Binataceae bacterium]|nr:TlpA disulfide reductase family protein [Candidatus Binataceae bacterium]
MRPIRRSLILVALLVLSSCAITSGVVGDTAPALIAEELSGQTFDLAAMRGKVVIVSFWATWCPPCRAEMPELEAFYRQYHSRGVDLIGLSVDRERDRAEVIKIMKEFTYPAAMAEDAQADGFGEPAVLPVTYVVDRNGIVRAKFTPDQTPVTEKSLAAAVLPLLGGQS